MSKVGRKTPVQSDSSKSKAPTNKNGKEKTIEEEFQTLEAVEHVLVRPDTYIGSLEKQSETQWILEEIQQKVARFAEQNISYSPGLYKIFDEIIVNTADSYQRSKTVNLVQIEINIQAGYIRVKNNGKGIPLQMHKKAKLLVPQVIFGTMFSGSNFNDTDDKRYGGGRNGFGAKLTNIFSHTFIVRCATDKKLFTCKWTKNMSNMEEPVIVSTKENDFVEITFYPDFPRFGMKQLQTDIVRLFQKRAYDIAGVIPKVRVILNGKEIKIGGFSAYVDMYLNSGDNENPIKIVMPKGEQNQYWEVIISRSDGQPRHVSFVNAICTYKGGTHINYIYDQIIPKIQEKLKNSAVKPQFIKSKLFIFVNCLIINPKFDSQLKETLTSKVSTFGSKWEMPQKMMKAILATGITEELISEATARQMVKMQKATGGGKKSRIDVPKLEDANDAGKRGSEQCVLILTEGDSAKALAVSGLSVLGRDKYGVFPLKGKLMNVREKDNKSVTDNAEVANIVKIIGLQYGKTYTQVDLKNLRYGSIMIMTDQDHDGSHIKGLIINLVHHFWPSLFKLKGFLREFITPLMKVNKGNQSKSFFTQQDYVKWKDSTENSKSWKVKYYKGLGTSTNKEGQEYFKNIGIHEKIFRYEDNEDISCIDMAFSRKKVQERKEWLAQYNYQDILEIKQSIKEIRYKDFINKELIHFSISSNKRAIPSVMDGLKPGQRKIIYSCFKRKLREQIKVAQLAGYVAEHSAYHHGQASLTQTIIGLAQNFVGSNNINLLMPNGQFGSRAEGGSDHASARYIYTCLNRVTRAIFPEDDDHTLTYLEDDGQVVEPEYYAPIIPMVLVNGADGVGTGWSTNIPNFNPREIVEQLKKKLNGDQMTNMLPWYKGFIGEIVQDINGIKIRGIISEDTSNKETVHITELPIGKWTIKMKQELNQFFNKENENRISNFKEHHKDNCVHFEIEFNEHELDKQDAIEKLYKYLKLTSSKKFTNMVAFDNESRIHRYHSWEDMMNQFFGVRMKHYSDRKKYLTTKLIREVEINRNKVRFIRELNRDEIKLGKAKRQQILSLLEKVGYTKYSQFTKVFSTKGKKLGSKPGDVEVVENEEQNVDFSANQEDEKSTKGKRKKNEPKEKSSDYDYLLGMAMWSLTEEKAAKLQSDLEEMEVQLEALLKKDERQMWTEDLDNFVEVLGEVEEKERKEREKADAMIKKDGKNKKIGKRVRKTKKDDSSSDEEDGPKKRKPAQKKNKQAQMSEEKPNKKASPVRKEQAPKPKKGGKGQEKRPASIISASQSPKSSRSPKSSLFADTPLKDIKGLQVSTARSEGDPFSSRNPSQLSKNTDVLINRPKIKKRQDIFEERKSNGLVPPPSAGSNGSPQRQLTIEEIYKKYKMGEENNQLHLQNERKERIKTKQVEMEKINKGAERDLQNKQRLNKEVKIYEEAEQEFVGPEVLKKRRNNYYGDSN